MKKLISVLLVLGLLLGMGATTAFADDEIVFEAEISLQAACLCGLAGCECAGDCPCVVDCDCEACNPTPPPPPPAAGLLETLLAQLKPVLEEMGITEAQLADVTGIGDVIALISSAEGGLLGNIGKIFGAINTAELVAAVFPNGFSLEGIMNALGLGGDNSILTTIYNMFFGEDSIFAKIIEAIRKFFEGGLLQMIQRMVGIFVEGEISLFLKLFIPSGKLFD